MNMKNNKLVLVLLMLVVFISGCYKEPDLISEISKSVGKVPQVSIVWLGTTRTTAASTAIISGQTVVAGASTFVNVEFTSLVPIKEFRVYYAANATGAQTLVSTTPSGGQKYNADLREYTIAIPITAQAAAGTTRVFFAEIVGTDGLLSAQKSAILTTSK